MIQVSSLRYYLAYRVELIGHYGIDVRGYKLSLPVAALVHSSIEAEASLFWNRSFASGVSNLLSRRLFINSFLDRNTIVGTRQCAMVNRTCGTQSTLYGDDSTAGD